MRCVITANDEHGRSIIAINEETLPHGVIWETSPDAPLGYAPIPSPHDLDVKPGHTIIRHSELPPDAMMHQYLRRGVPGLDENGFHKTNSIDFIVLLEGRLTLELDQGQAEILPGDVVVQRNTNHAWRNAEDTPARILCVMTKLPDSGE